jgi:hypothetical protein
MRQYRQGRWPGNGAGPPTADTRQDKERNSLNPDERSQQPAGNLYLVVGYDGSPPTGRALAAVSLLYNRTGSTEVVYVAHLPSIDMLSADAIGEMEISFDEIARDLHASASDQLRDREERWRFERRQGLIADELIAVAAGIRDAHPGDTVVIVVGSSSHATHRVVGSAWHPGRSSRTQSSLVAPQPGTIARSASKRTVPAVGGQDLHRRQVSLTGRSFGRIAELHAVSDPGLGDARPESIASRLLPAAGGQSRGWRFTCPSRR